MIEELQLVFTVRDKNARRKLGITYTPKYIGAMVKLLQWCQWESVNPIHGMVEVELWPITIGKNQQFLKRKKIYSLAHIIRGVHIIPAILAEVQY